MTLGSGRFRLAPSNFRIWDGSAEVGDAESLARQLEMHVDHRRSGSTTDDIVHEILLKTGYPLATRVEIVELAARRCSRSRVARW